MSYEIDQLTEYFKGSMSGAQTRNIDFGVTAADSKTFVFAVKVSGVAGGGPTYANMTMYTSFDGGSTWQAVSNTVSEAITANGLFRVYPTGSSSPVGPLVRIALVTVAGQSLTIEGFYRTKVAPGDSTFPSASSGAGAAITSPLGAQAEASSVGVALATDQGIRGVDPGGANPEILVETTGELRVAQLVPEKWLGMTGTEVSATQETYEFFEDAAKLTSICTITVDYSDATKEFVSSVTRT